MAVSNRRIVRWARIGVRAAYRTVPLIGLTLAVSCSSPAPQPPQARPIAPSSVVPPPVSRPAAAPAQLSELGPLVISESELPGYTRGAPLAAPDGKPGITVPFTGPGTTIDVSIIPLPAVNPQPVYEQAVDQFVANTPDEFDSHVDIGDQGTRVDVAGTPARPNTTTVMFRVRNYFGIVRFQSPNGVPIRDDLVLPVCNKQADKIEAAG